MASGGAVHRSALKGVQYSGPAEVKACGMKYAQEITLATVMLIAVGCKPHDASRTPPISAAEQAVKSTLAIRFTEYRFEEVDVRGGRAVLLNNLGAYWVKDGVVYALNGLAKSYSPSVEYGPVGLDYEDVERAIGR